MTIKILRKLYAGVYGELTSALTHFYQTLIFDGEVANLFYEMYVEDFKNVEKLGRNLRSKGALPLFYTNSQIPWSARNIDYSANLNCVLFYSIRRIRKEIDKLYGYAKLNIEQDVKDLIFEIIQIKENQVLRIDEIIKKYGY